MRMAGGYIFVQLLLDGGNICNVLFRLWFLGMISDEAVFGDAAATQEGAFLFLLMTVARGYLPRCTMDGIGLWLGNDYREGTKKRNQGAFGKQIARGSFDFSQSIENLKEESL